MSLYRIEDTSLTAIADAIRAKLGSTSSLTPADMAAAIPLISGEGGGNSLSFLLDDTVTTIPLSDVTSLLVNNSNVYQVLLNGVAIWGEKAGYTNLLPFATDTDGVTIYGGDYDGDGDNDGYKTATRLSGSSGSTVSGTTALMCTSGFIPASDGAVIRIKGTLPVSGVASYIITYDSSMSRIAHWAILQGTSTWASVINTQTTFATFADDLLTVTLDSTQFGTGIAYIRFSCNMDGDTIVTVNEEITE